MLFYEMALRTWLILVICSWSVLKTDSLGTGSTATPETARAGAAEPAGHAEPAGQVETAAGEAEPETEPAQEPEPEFEPAQEPGASEQEPEGERFELETIIQWISLFTICIILILVGNIVVMVIILKNKETRGKVANVFFMSLLVARTSVAILVIPARMTGLFSNELLGSVLCKLCHFAGRGSAVTSVFSTTAVALAKYHELSQPPNAPPVPLRTSILLTVGMWVLGYAWAIRAPLMNTLFLAQTTMGPMWVCGTPPDHAYISSIFIFVDFALLFFIPFGIVIFCYCKVIRVLNAMRKQMKLEQSPGNDLEGAREKIAIQVGAIRMLIVVTILFMVCYSLPYIFKLYVYFKDVNVLMSNFAEVEMWVYLISYSNPWLNVFVYIIFREDIRVGLRTMCGRNRNGRPGKVGPSPATSATSVNAIDVPMLPSSYGIKKP